MSNNYHPALKSPIFGFLLVFALGFWAGKNFPLPMTHGGFLVSGGPNPNLAVRDWSMRKLGYARAPAAPNGLPWPVDAQYLQGYAVDAAGGQSTVTADNRGNTTAVLGKLVTLLDGTPHVVRMFYVPAKSILNLEHVAPGRYEIYSQELDTGRVFKTVAFATTVTASDGVPRNQNWAVGLFPQLQGNSPRTEISETQFERGP